MRAGTDEALAIKRPLVVAVSNSEQQRETLVILLDADFDVQTAPALGVASGTGARPAAVVLSPTRWDTSLPAQAQTSWPTAPLVFLDAPPELRRAFPTAARASWSDPLSVAAAVAGATDLRAAASPPLADACAWLERASGSEVRLPLRTARGLAAMADDFAPTSVSRHISLRFLIEQLHLLAERLVWVEAAVEPRGERQRSTDLTAALARVIDESRPRLHNRGIEVEWLHRQPLPIACSETSVRLAAQCIRNHLIQLPAGPLRLRADGSALVAEYSYAAASTDTIALAAVAFLLRQSAALYVDGGRLEIRVEAP